MTNGCHGSVICLDEVEEMTHRKSFPNARIDDAKIIQPELSSSKRGGTLAIVVSMR